MGNVKTMIRQRELQRLFPTIEKQKEEIRGLVEECELSLGFVMGTLNDIKRMLKLKVKPEKK